MDSRGGAAGHVAPSTRRSSSPLPKSGYYRVRRGDTLFSIAWRANRDFRQLARWNNIQPPYVIYVGQSIRLNPVGPSRQLRSGSSAGVSRKSRTRPAETTRRAGRAQTGAMHRGILHWQWPAWGKVVSTFKSGDPLHKGVKIAGHAGDPVRAAEAGKVVYSGSGLIGYGRLIIIKHNDKYLSAYGHNRKLLVTQNQQVTKGQKIAEMGTANDGRVLLHFEIRRDGQPVNPLALLPRR